MDLLCIRGYTVYNGRRCLLLRFVRWFIVCQRFLSLLNYKDKAVAQIMHFNMLLLMTNKRIVKNLVATLLSKFIKNVDIYMHTLQKWYFQ